MKNARTMLKERSGAGGPVRVALIGAGPLSRILAAQVAAEIPSVTLVAVADDALAAARRVFADAGLRVPRVVESAFGLQAAARWEEPAITRNWRLLCESPLIDVVVDATGDPELGGEITSTAAASGKLVIPAAEGQGHKDSTTRIELVRLNVDAAALPDMLGIGKDLAPVQGAEATPHVPAGRA